LFIARYSAVSGLLVVWWYFLKREKNASRKIPSKFPSRKEYLREIVCSLLTMLVYTGFVALVYFPHKGKS
jgi:hypothetical protein